MDARLYAACIRGRECSLTYLPRDPNVHCLGPAGPRLQIHNDTTNLVALAASLAFAFLLAFVEISARRELRLAHAGEAAEGRVVEKTSARRGNGTVYGVRYLFDAADGEVRSGWVKVGPILWGWLHHGSRITVLYDPDHPGRHRPSFAFRFVQFLAAEEQG